MSDWVTAKLKEVAKVVTGKTPQTSNSEYYGGDIPFVSPADLNEGILSETKTYLTSSGADQVYRVPENTVLVSCIGNLGKLAITSKEVCFNQQINGLIFDEQKIFPKYGFYFAQTLKPQLEKASSSTTLPIVNKSRFSDLEIKYPPLEEQRRIASILDQADELRQKRQQAIEKLDQLLQATFIDMFGDPVSNPKGWDIFKSKSLFQAPPRIGTTTPANGEGIPVVRVGELGQFHIDFEKCGRVQISESDFKKYELKNGDLVLARAIGSKNQLGKCSYFSEYFEPVCIDSHVMRLRPDSKKLHPLWFYFLLSSDQGKKILQSKGGATAVQFNINSAQANDLDIALPPLSEQAKFVEIANKILKNKDSHIKFLERNNLLFSSLQNQAFNGTL